VAAVEAAAGRKEQVLKIRVLKGQSDGAASALKLSYAGMTKGFTGLAATMILAASKHSTETATALLQELSESQPDFVRKIAGGVPGCLPKAYRWVGEMEEIASYVNASIGSAGGTYTGLAELYQHITDDVNGAGKDAETLKGFARQAKDAVP